MKIALLARAHTYTSQRLSEEARKQGNELVFVNHDMVEVVKGLPYLNGKLQTGFDCVLPRIMHEKFQHGILVTRAFEKVNSVVINNSKSILESGDKVETIRLLSEAGVAVPKTVTIKSINELPKAVKALGLPIVIKLSNSSQGAGVYLAKTLAEAEMIIGDIHEAYSIQEFIEDAKGSDIRVFVVGGEVIAAMRRQGRPGEFRSNIHLGGAAKRIVLSEAEINAALKCAEILGLHIAGIDLLRSKRGPLIIEANSSPGLEGIETTTGQNVAARIVEYISSLV